MLNARKEQISKYATKEFAKAGDDAQERQEQLRNLRGLLKSSASSPSVAHQFPHGQSHQPQSQPSQQQQQRPPPETDSQYNSSGKSHRHSNRDYSAPKRGRPAAAGYSASYYPYVPYGYSDSHGSSGDTCSHFSCPNCSRTAPTRYCRYATAESATPFTSKTHEEDLYKAYCAYMGPEVPCDPGHRFSHGYSSHSVHAYASSSPSASGPYSSPQSPRCDDASETYAQRIEVQVQMYKSKSNLHNFSTHAYSSSSASDPYVSSPASPPSYTAREAYDGAPWYPFHSSGERYSSSSASRQGYSPASPRRAEAAWEEFPGRGRKSGTSFLQLKEPDTTLAIAPSVPPSSQESQATRAQKDPRSIDLAVSYLLPLILLWRILILIQHASNPSM